MWVGFTTINLLRDIYSRHLQKIGRPGALVLLQPAGNAVKLLILILIIGLLVYLDKLGINITTVLAGLALPARTLHIERDDELAETKGC